MSDSQGELPTLTTTEPASRFAVRIQLDEQAMKTYRLPAGASGSAAIYTKQLPSMKILRKVIIRWYTWLNYVKFAL